MSKKELKNHILNTCTGLNNPIEKTTNLRRWKFRLAGSLPDRAIRIIEIDTNLSVKEIKRAIQREFKLNPILAIQLIVKGKVLQDNLKLNEIGINLKKNLITVMSVQSGAMGKREMKCIQCGTANINEILVSFIAEDERGQRYEDITTLPKFLYYLEHPLDKRGKRILSPTPYKIVKVKNYCCANCFYDKAIEGKKGDGGLRIPSRRYGI